MCATACSEATCHYWSHLCSTKEIAKLTGNADVIAADTRTAAASAVCNTAIAIITIKQPIVNAARNT